jgi:ferredoxin
MSTWRELARIERTLEIEVLPTGQYRMSAGFEILDREAPPTLDLGRRTGIAEVETGYGTAEARAQAARCLVCHVQTIYDPEKCVLCSRCVDVCPEFCLAIVPFEQLDLPEADARGASGAGRGERSAVVGHGERRRPLHPLRPVRHPVPDRRHDHGEVSDHRAVREGVARSRPGAGEFEMTDRNDRRDFIMKAGLGAGVCGLGLQAAASLRSLVPNVSYDAPTTVKLGNAHRLSRRPQVPARPAPVRLP